MPVQSRAINQRSPLPQGKIQDEFSGCRRQERLQPPRTTPKNKKGFLGTLWPTKSTWRASNKVKWTTELKRDISQLHQNPSHNTPKKLKETHSTGENSGRIFRLSAPGAPTTEPDNTKEQKGLSGYSLAHKEYLARIKQSQMDHRTQARHTSAVQISTASTPPKNEKKPTPPGENSGRIFRLSAPGAPTTASGAPNSPWTAL